jgi:3-oxoadipate enol-lactonase
LAVDIAGSGQLVLFLHGIGGNRSNWTEQLTAVGGDFLGCAWDARGYGGSDDYEGPLRFADFRNDVLRVLDHFSARTAHLVGLSMGGLIAQDFYRCHPDRVLSLTLADTRNTFQRFNNEDFLRRREAPLLAGKSPRDIAPSLAPTLASPHAERPVIQRLEESIAALRKESYLKTLRAVTLCGGDPEFRGAAGFVELKSINVPTLVICGADDSVTPPEMSRSMAQQIPHAKLHIVAGAGHLTNIEKPAEFNAVLLDFLRGASAPHPRPATNTAAQPRN